MGLVGEDACGRGRCESKETGREGIIAVGQVRTGELFSQSSRPMRVAGAGRKQRTEDEPGRTISEVTSLCSSVRLLTSSLICRSAAHFEVTNLAGSVGRKTSSAEMNTNGVGGVDGDETGFEASNVRRTESTDDDRHPIEKS